MAFYDSAKHQKTVGKTTFWSIRKSWSKYNIKPVAYWDFWGTFAKWLQKVSKSIRFSVKVDGVLRLCKTSKTVGKTTFWSIRKSWFKYPIKPVVYCDFGPLFAKLLQKVSKSIRFPSKSWRRFTTLRNIKKPLVKQRLGAPELVDQNTL